MKAATRSDRWYSGYQYGWWLAMQRMACPKGRQFRDNEELDGALTGWAACSGI